MSRLGPAMQPTEETSRHKQNSKTTILMRVLLSAGDLVSGVQHSWTLVVIGLVDSRKMEHQTDNCDECYEACYQTQRTDGSS